MKKTPPLFFFRDIRCRTIKTTRVQNSAGKQDSILRSYCWHIHITSSLCWLFSPVRLPFFKGEARLFYEFVIIIIVVVVVIIIIIIIIYQSWCWATCCPVPVSCIQKSLQRSAMIPSASWGISVSLPWVICYEAFYLHTVSSFSCIPVICPKLVLFLIPLEFVYLFCNRPSLSCCSSHVYHFCCCYSLASFALTVQVSLPYNRTGRASLLYNFILVFLRFFVV